MEAVAHLDTHVVVWLHGGLEEKIPKPARQIIEAHSLLVSPAVALELQYLHEIKRLKATSRAVLADLDARIGLRQSAASFAAVALEACGARWTRDPFDRLIVGSALAEEAVLLTADQLIRKYYKLARWD